MFVFRPQQTLTHAPSCGSSARHHECRQAVKNQRRTQPKPRRQQALQRRRHLLRDLFAAGQVGHQPALASAECVGSPKLGPACPTDSFHNFLDTARGGRCQGGVHARLCARLLERSSAELEKALERRHGVTWPEHVLQGDFHCMEGMRRICESFCLRPELEHQVLKATKDRAQAILKRQAEHRSGKQRRAAHRSIAVETVEIDVNVDPDSDGSTRQRTQTESTTDADQAASSVDDDASVAGTLDGASSDATSFDEGLMNDGDLMRIRMASEDTTSGASSSDGESSNAQPWRDSWQRRALRVLGLQRILPAQSTPASVQQKEPEGVKDFKEPPASLGPGQQREKVCADDDEDEEEEERLLSSKLVAAVKNAELHAAKTMSDLPSCNDTPPSPVTGRAASGGNSSSVRFARSSEVSFFECHEEAAAPAQLARTLLQYQRSLETKVFDGPSGHKAKRTLSSDKVSSPREYVEEESLSPEDEEDEWEDHCDDIAELMSQQRSGMLWAAAW